MFQLKLNPHLQEHIQSSFLINFVCIIYTIVSSFFVGVSIDVFGVKHLIRVILFLKTVLIYFWYANEFGTLLAVFLF